MDGPGDQLLAGARLAHDQDIAVGADDRLHHAEEPLHRGGCADQVVHVVTLSQFPVDDDRALAQLLVLLRLGDGARNAG